MLEYQYSWCYYGDITLMLHNGGKKGYTWSTGKPLVISSRYYFLRLMSMENYSNTIQIPQPDGMFVECKQYKMDILDNIIYVCCDYDVTENCNFLFWVCPRANQIHMISFLSLAYHVRYTDLTLYLKPLLTLCLCWSYKHQHHSHITHPTLEKERDYYVVYKGVVPHQMEVWPHYCLWNQAYYWFTRVVGWLFLAVNLTTPGINEKPNGWMYLWRIFFLIE